MNTLIMAKLTFPVKVTTTLQIRNPKNTSGIVSLAVNPRVVMTVLTVDASGGASKSEVQ